MKDKDLRDLTLRELYQKHNGENNTRIINEMGLINGASRVDIAVVNGILHGYELKSESDNLLRLPNQVENYNRIFERMTIVVDRKYVDAVKEIIPEWWGIMTVRKDKAGLRSLRKGRRVKTKDEEALLNLLWKEEYDGLVDLLGYPKKYKRMLKKDLFEIMLQDRRKDIIKKYIYDALRRRDYS